MIIPSLLIVASTTIFSNNTQPHTNTHKYIQIQYTQGHESSATHLLYYYTVFLMKCIISLISPPLYFKRGERRERRERRERGERERREREERGERERGEKRGNNGKSFPNSPYLLT
jgi:hypothetical protein